MSTSSTTEGGLGDWQPGVAEEGDDGPLGGIYDSRVGGGGSGAVLQGNEEDDEVGGQGMIRRHSSLSLPEEVMLGLSPQPPHDCEDCLHLHRQQSASQLHHLLHHHHHHLHQHQHQQHHAPPALAFSPTSSSASPTPCSSPPGPGAATATANATANAAGAREGLPPRLPVLQQRLSSVLPYPPATDLMTSASASSFAFSPSYQPPPAPPVPSPHMGAYAIPQRSVRPLRRQNG